MACNPSVIDEWWYPLFIIVIFLKVTILIDIMALEKSDNVVGLWQGGRSYIRLL